MAFVQAQTTTKTTSGASPLTSASFTSTAGNLLVVGIVIPATAQALTSFSDTTNNTWTPITGNSLVVAGMTIYGFYAKNINGGAGTFSVAWNNGNSAPTFIVHEFSGRDTSSPIDIEALYDATGEGYVQSHHGVTLTGVAATADVFTFGDSTTNAATVYTATGGWTKPTGGWNAGTAASDQTCVSLYQGNVSSGNYQMTYSTDGFVRNFSLGMSFKAASASGASSRRKGIVRPTEMGRTGVNLFRRRSGLLVPQYAMGY